MKTINIKQDQMFAVPVSDDDIVLTSGGIGPCICILAKGMVGDVHYLAIYHWSGFSCLFKDGGYTEHNLKNEITELFVQFSLIIACAMSDHEDDPDVPPSLSHLYLVGGQREEKDASTGEILVSGTELEANALVNYAQTVCANIFTTTGDTRYENIFYTASGSDDLRVFFSLSTPLKVKKNSDYDPDEENDSDAEALTTSRFSP